MSSPEEKVIYVLTGPTAVGKTELSLGWAERFGAEIISCDSLLFYRGMDIGTAKPTTADRARVPHHLIDTCEIHERMDVTRYVAAVRGVLSDIHAAGKRPLVAGGSGFYLASFFRPVADAVTVPDEVRKRISSTLEQTGLGALVEELRRLDPEGATTIDLCNPRRVVRALERIHATGRCLGELADDFRRMPLPFEGWTPRLVCLDRDLADLQARIEQRVQLMIAAGLVDEVAWLISRGLKENPSASKAIGYREVIDLLEGRLSRDELVPRIVSNTRALVKKQRTWFRTQLPSHASMDARTAGVAELFSQAEDSRAAGSVQSSKETR